MEKTPVRARIPQWSISEIEPILKALAELSAPSSTARIAQQLGVSPTGGKFRSQLGTAKYYGGVRRRGGLQELTARGAAIVGDDEDAARRARREAVMSTALGPIIRRFAGREPNEATIAARLEDDFGATTAASSHLASVLIRAAREAELLTNHRFDVAAIESVGDVAPPEPETNSAAPGTPPESVEPGRRPQQERERASKPRAEEQEQRARPEVTARPFGAAIRVVVNVDASTWTPQQVSELIRALQRPQELNLPKDS